jgi:hypothetical protein
MILAGSMVLVVSCLLAPLHDGTTWFDLVLVLVGFASVGFPIMSWINLFVALLPILLILALYDKRQDFNVAPIS